MQNLAISDTGAIIHEFSSQYHHESRCSNLLLRDPSLVWFTSVTEQLPQYVIFKLKSEAEIYKVGIYLHGENNQNPKRIEILVSENGKDFISIIESELEHRAGDFLFKLDKPINGSFVKFLITENFGGSGIYISKCFVFGKLIEKI
ncbi:f5/8 type c domain containing protein [Anaeramoeba ignava]|uniref:F5/8 type c domain containing protein n=1 Tax=Anaeramoeba ignava TaxID=1746090 RepID=A0A9Q0LSY8_ANAIG|nr:f5/8 type c domain containing protein [Anaeramoeba ignava]